MESRPIALIIEDDEDLNEIFSFALEKAGYTVKSVYDGITAQNFLAGIVPALIILDLHMPLKNGLDFLHWRQSSPFARIPVIVFTGLEDLGERRRALACGANLVLEKPLKFQELVELVRNIGSISLDNEKVTSCSVSHA